MLQVDITAHEAMRMFRRMVDRHDILLPDICVALGCIPPEGVLTMSLWAGRGRLRLHRVRRIRRGDAGAVLAGRDRAGVVDRDWVDGHADVVEGRDRMVDQQLPHRLGKL